MTQDIPGFYYDEEKKKYFRIQPNHRVVPGSGYTTQYVKEQREAKAKRQRMQQQVRRHQLGKIKRSPIWAHTASLFSARLGAAVPRNREEILRHYGSSLSRYSINDNACYYAGSHAGFVGSSFSISRSSCLRAVYLYPGDKQLLSIPSAWTPTTVVTNACPFEFDCLSSTDGQLVATLYSNHTDEAGCMVVASARSHGLIFEPINPGGRVDQHAAFTSIDFETRQVEMIWDIAAAPDRPYLAIATDAGLLSGDIQNIHRTTFSFPPDSSGKEQMNVCFKDSNIIMSGERSGRVNFMDTRVSRSVVRLLHSSAVLATSPLHDSNQILVHGYSTTSTYDLRWTQPTPVSRKARFTNLDQHSKPYIVFAVPRDRQTNAYTRGRKVAYSSDLEIVAAASSFTSDRGTRGRVTLYSARTGKAIDSPLTRCTYNDHVRCVDIKRVRDGLESIFCMSEARLDEWTCG